ncbi:hypothetical protein COCSUDRAFT_11753, partial [Coccomyxa subellipsoidea C-169]
ISLLKTALNPAEAGRGLYFSYGADLAQFVLPLMQGSVHQISNLRFQTSVADYTGSLTLIARRSAQRPGVRHWRRGAEPTGKVANFVETEQLVELTAQGSSNPAVVSSFVQVRGSIPLLWSQIPNIKYKPTTRISPPSVYEPAFDNHINDLISSYQNVLAVNLANQNGSEGILGKAFKEEAERFAKVKPGFEVISFDFHKECGATRYDRLEKLWAMIEPFVERFGTFQANGEQRRQSGVLRINCIDCLDRTNVVQGWLARKQLDRLLAQLSLLPQGSSIKEAFPEVERQFKWVWADHGDDISRQYAGTGALKSGFTRTGQRTMGGLLDDGAKSMTRYFLNNFRDGRKQDALDLLTGTYAIAKGLLFFSNSNLNLLSLVSRVLHRVCGGAWGRFTEGLEPQDMTNVIRLYYLETGFEVHWGKYAVVSIAWKERKREILGSSAKIGLWLCLQTSRPPSRPPSLGSPSLRWPCCSCCWQP